MPVVSIKQQRASAILLALLFMVLSASLALAFHFRYSIALRRSDDIFAIDRLIAVEKAAVAWAMTVLQQPEEHASSELYNDLTQTWAQAMPEWHIEGLTVNAKIIDANSLFNVNNLLLAAEKKKTVEQNDEYSVAAVMQRLLSLLATDQELTSLDAQGLLLAIKISLGVEKSGESQSDLASLKEQPISALPMANVSELRVVPSVDAAIFNVLQQFFTAIPIGQYAGEKQARERVKFNINTVSAEHLAALLDISVDEAVTVLDSRPFRNKANMSNALAPYLNNSSTVGTAASLDIDAWLQVHSDYFFVISQVKDTMREISVYTLLKREQGKNFQVLFTSRGTL